MESRGARLWDEKSRISGGEEWLETGGDKERASGEDLESSRGCETELECGFVDETRSNESMGNCVNEQENPMEKLNIELWQCRRID